MMCAPVLCGREIRSVLAPMAGYTDVAFRRLCRELGAGLTVSEMVSVRGLIHGNAATQSLMVLSEEESPSCIQLFGSEPEDFARAAGQVRSDIIDINMGCPMPKIVKNGDGAALMRDPERAYRIVRALCDSTDRPVTVKTRLGYSAGDGIGLAELAEAVQKGGAAALTVHGRYAEQRYAGVAVREPIRQVAKSLGIPVVLNGDVRALGEDGFGCVMIGRYALENPAVFSGEKHDPFRIADRHLRLLLEYFDDRYSVLMCRKFFVHYFKGMRGSKALRDDVNRAESTAEVFDALDRAQKYAIMEG